MKAMMSEKLRNILNNPQLSRELQKQLSQSSDISLREEKKEISKDNHAIHQGLRSK